MGVTSVVLTQPVSVSATRARTTLFVSESYRTHRGSREATPSRAASPEPPQSSSASVFGSLAPGHRDSGGGTAVRDIWRGNRRLSFTEGAAFSLRHRCLQRELNRIPGASIRLISVSDMIQYDTTISYDSVSAPHDAPAFESRSGGGPCRHQQPGRPQ
jgi:hypothetical protein